MRLVQFKTLEKQRRVGAVEQDDRAVRTVDGTESVYALAIEAAESGRALQEYVLERLSDEAHDLAVLLEERRVLPPIDHPDPAKCWVTGTGLTHLGSASARNTMHADGGKTESSPTDSMKMFRLGVEGGKPEPGEVGVQPEWFYKGDGTCVVAPESPLRVPSFGLDASEEPEVVGIYVIARTGVPCRVGFALGNEFSDHVMERQNYLYLAHSKLRPCSFGPELLLGQPPEDIRGRSRVVRAGQTLWEGEFLTGEVNMSHSIRNLEHHHFKYAMFRRPGDVHCHFFGTATLSFAAGVRAQAGDVFEISSDAFGAPLRNPVEVFVPDEPNVRVL